MKNPITSVHFNYSCNSIWVDIGLWINLGKWRCE